MMEGTPEQRLAAVEATLARLVEILEPIAAAWARFGPELERRFDNRVSRWKAAR